MKIEISSENYEVIETGTVIAFEESSDVTFHFNDGKGFQFSLELKFKNDENEKQIIHRTVVGNTIKYECINFSNAGTGTSTPIELLQYGDKKIYIRFWMCLEGDVAGAAKSRKIDYTFYAGK